jgi:hypothetical protein
MKKIIGLKKVTRQINARACGECYTHTIFLNDDVLSITEGVPILTISPGRVYTSASMIAGYLQTALISKGFGPCQIS